MKINYFSDYKKNSKSAFEQVVNRKHAEHVGSKSTQDHRSKRPISINNLID